VGEGGKKFLGLIVEEQRLAKNATTFLIFSQSRAGSSPPVKERMFRESLISECK
jgi:hypothetical protein